MRAALARDVGKAVKLSREHIERTTEKVAKSLAQVRAAPKLRIANGRPAK